MVPTLVDRSGCFSDCGHNCESIWWSKTTHLLSRQQKRKDHEGPQGLTFPFESHPRNLRIIEAYFLKSLSSFNRTARETKLLTVSHLGNSQDPTGVVVHLTLMQALSEDSR